MCSAAGTQLRPSFPVGSTMAEVPAEDATQENVNHDRELFKKFEARGGSCRDSCSLLCIALNLAFSAAQCKQHGGSVVQCNSSLPQRASISRIHHQQLRGQPTGSPPLHLPTTYTPPTAVLCVCRSRSCWARAAMA